MEELGIRDLLLALASGAFVMAYLMFFSPSGPLTSHAMFIKLLGYALITILFLLFNAFVIKNLLQIILKADHWTIGKQFIWYGYVIFMIGLLNYYYSHSLELYGFTIEEHIISAFIFGTFLFGIFLIINHRYLSNKYGERAGIFNQLLSKPKIKSEQLFSFTLKKNHEPLKVQDHELSIIKKCKNGSQLYLVDKGNPIVVEVLDSFYELQEKHTNDTIVRCNENFLVNLINVEQIIGTAQGYCLKFFLHNEKIKVDPKCKKAFQEKMQSI